jgi:hypothetical protein
MRACGAARRNRYAAGSLPAARGPRRRRRGETPLERRCGGGWRVRRLRDRFRAIRTHTRGAGRMGRGRGGELACTGRHRSASLIHLQRARPCRPVPFFVAIGDSRSASRPPIAFAVAPFKIRLRGAGRRRWTRCPGIFVCARRLAFREPAAVHCCALNDQRPSIFTPGRSIFTVDCCDS